MRYTRLILENGMPERYALYLHFGTRRAHDRKKIGLAAGGETNQKRRARAGIKFVWSIHRRTPSSPCIVVNVRSRTVVSIRGKTKRGGTVVWVSFSNSHNELLSRHTQRAVCAQHTRATTETRAACGGRGLLDTHSRTHTRAQRGPSRRGMRRGRAQQNEKAAERGTRQPGQHCARERGLIET